MYCDLRDDTERNLSINKNRDLNYTLTASAYTGNTSWSGFTGASLQVRVRPNDNYSILTFTTADGSIVLGALGQFTLKKTADQLQNIESGDFLFDMYLSSASSKRKALYYGSFMINATIAK